MAPLVERGFDIQSRLAASANLAYDKFKQYLRSLVEQQYIKAVTCDWTIHNTYDLHKNSKVILFPTKKGEAFTRNYVKIKRKSTDDEY